MLISTKITCTNPVLVQRPSRVRWLAVAIIISFVLILIAILAIVLSTAKHNDSFPADPIPVVQNSIQPIPVPTPPPTSIQPASSQFSSLKYDRGTKPSVPAIPAPTPPPL